MKKFETTAKYNDVKVAAKELGIKFVGVNTQDLIAAVNAKIDELTPKKETKKVQKASKSLEDYGLMEGQIVKIAGFEVKGKRILENREVKITRPSRAKGYIKAQLINEVTGELQKTEIAITLDIILQGVYLPSTFVVGA